MPVSVRPCGHASSRRSPRLEPQSSLEPAAGIRPSTVSMVFPISNGLDTNRSAPAAIACASISAVPRALIATITRSRCSAVLAEQADRVEAVETGHHDVHQHYRRLGAADAVHAVDPVHGHVDHTTLVLEGERQDPRERLLVIDYEDSGCRHSGSSFRACMYSCRPSSAFSASTSRKASTTRRSNCVPE